MGQTDDRENHRIGLQDSSEHRLITLVSTHTLDRVASTGGKSNVETPGGPARYVAHALGRLNFPYRLITGGVANVDVLPGADGEQYVIPRLSPIPLPVRLEGDAIILSPVMREIDPDAVPPTEGPLVLDLQGFVRQPGRPSGEETEKVRLVSLLRRASVVKASKHELALLDTDSCRALGRAILVETRGVRGAIVRVAGREYTVPAQPVQTDNTIGAGDTFLAGFICSTLRGNGPVAAATAAARFTEAFLRERCTKGVTDGHPEAGT